MRERSTMRHDPRGKAIAICFMGILLSLFVVSSCGESGEEPEGAGNADDPVMIAVGKAVFEDWDCAGCHGVNREGTESGPPLSGLDAVWTVDTLAEYVSDPEEATAKSERLRKLSLEYGDSEMPAYDVFPAEERRALAAYLLSP
jgi:mono/diheme cytochrome c family protein